jgi:CheY-like chemotaxis protein
MVVDDVAANLQVMAAELERGGYSVVVAQAARRRSNAPRSSGRT